MSKEKKERTSNYRLTLVDDDTHDKLWTRKFNKLNILVTAITYIVLLLST